MLGTPSSPPKVVRPWGWYTLLHQDAEAWVKQLVINPGASTSLQLHEYREEYWYVQQDGLAAVIGDRLFRLEPFKEYHVPYHVKHRLINNSQATGFVTEVALGVPDEDDIKRIHDVYGRTD